MNGNRWMSVMLSVLFLGSLAQADCSKEIQETLKRLTKNEFTAGRGLSEYYGAFGAQFQDEVARLSSQDQVMDFGAGVGRAWADYFEIFGRDKAKVIAFGYQRPKSFDLRMKGNLDQAEFVQKFSYLEGDLLETSKGLGSFHLGTDLYGVFSYTAQPDAVMNRYLQMMKSQKSKLYLYFDTDRSMIELANKKRVSIGEWLQSFRELRVERQVKEGQKESVSVVLLKDGFQLPPLKVQQFADDHPPVRLFKAQ